MSNCKACARATLCDWETPPENCLDYRLSTLPSVDTVAHGVINKFCEVVTRGGARMRGYVASIDGDYLILEQNNGTALAVDMNEGAELRVLSCSRPDSEPI